MARPIPPSRTFNLDDFIAKVGQDTRAVRTREKPGKIENSHVASFAARSTLLKEQFQGQVA
jgi:hypothetical protein